MEEKMSECLTKAVPLMLEARKNCRFYITAIVAIVASVVFFPPDANARKVYSPVVEKGELELEYHLDYVIDSNPLKNTAARHQFELEYGVTDRWATAIYGVFRKSPTQGFRYEEIKWENIYQLFEEGERWLDAGLYLEYIVPEGFLNRSDVIEFKLLLQKELNELTHKANITLKKELGTNAARSTAISFAWQSRWRWSHTFQPGIEIYSSLGELGNINTFSRQSHLIGPVVAGKVGEMKYDLGYLFGLTSGSNDGTLKLIVAYEF